MLWTLQVSLAFFSDGQILYLDMRYVDIAVYSLVDIIQLFRRPNFRINIDIMFFLISNEY